MNGESVEENANLVIRLLIRRPECLGPALRGEGEGLLKAIVDANKMSERIADRRKLREMEQEGDINVSVQLKRERGTQCDFNLFVELSYMIYNVFKYLYIKQKNYDYMSVIMLIWILKSSKIKLVSKNSMCDSF